MTPTLTAQLSLPGPMAAHIEPAAANGDQRSNDRANRLAVEDRAFHDWYRFVLSFPPHLVRHYLDDFNVGPEDPVLDPFCGTGTTVIEARRRHLSGIGLEANPFAHFASSVKIGWELSPDELLLAAQEIAHTALGILAAQGIGDNAPFASPHMDIPLRRLDPEAERLLLTNSISPLPLHKALVLLDCLNQHRGARFYQHGLLALASALVFKISNLHFGPEVGVGKLKNDVPVVSAWLAEIANMVNDLRTVAGEAYPPAVVHLADARNARAFLCPASIAAVITSPPYPNEKDYTRTTRLESVILGFVKNRAELRSLKKTLLRSNTRGVYVADNDDAWVDQHPEIDRIAKAIEARRIELGKNSGFERMYAKVTRLYFGGMARHLADLRPVLRPGAQLAYVVGDQASYLRVMIRTGQILADIAQTLGYEVQRIDLFRTRFATATREQLREEVVVLRWNGPQEG
ncbi:DNA methyltransferase [Candidatus Amarolinea dominans]|uniref:DNA methyltransferase n=1 Tax=Candidatus Amarolinea dominans TaxID=3140696 RepID=UPI0031CC67DA